MTAPLRFTWDGDVMRPRIPSLADKQFVVGQTYTLEERQERSHASHAHFFSVVNEIWQNLPDHLAERFPSADALRKFALIKTGYCDVRSVVCASRADAQRVAAFVQPIDQHAVVSAQDAVVTIYTAQSQSYRTMDKARFQASKTAVLDYLASLIGTTAADVERASAA